MYIGVVSWREKDPRRQNNFTLSLQGEILIHVVPRAIAKISSCWVFANSRRGIVQLGSTFGSTFLLFFFTKVARA